MFKNLLFTLLLILSSTFNITTVKAEEIDLKLINAVTTGDIKEVKVLIKIGIDINIKDKNSETALVHASKNGHLEIVRILLDNNVELIKKESILLDYNYTELGNQPLTVASFYGHIDIVKLLLENGNSNVDYDYINVYDQVGGTALTAAIVGNQIKVIILLIKNGADVNAQTGDEEWTPLMTAVHEDNYDIVKLLIENKANINAQSSSGETALRLATNARNIKIIKLLKSAGAKK